MVFCFPSTVYKHLEQYDRAVTGGHIGVVGCGGQITGGGTSQFLHRQGFSFANVKNFEVVVGGGRIVNANAEENEDLFWALKGGASNFGVVTRLDMRTFPLTGVWGGSIVHDISKKQDVLDAYWEFQQEGIVKDPGVEMLLGFSIVGDQSRIQSEVCADRRGHAEGSCPIAFKPFFDIGLLYSDAYDRTFPDLAVSATANPPPEFALWFSPHGRMNFAMVSLKPDRTFYSDAVDIFYSAFEPARRVPDAQVNVHLSALQGRTVRHANELGGMAAGWDEEDQLFFNIEMVWSAAEDDELMLKLTRQCIDRIKDAAIERGVFLPFIWMNNSQTEDDVLTSYGASNYSKMKQVSREYDPGQTFQKLCSGPFKLNESI
ncbi:hypothetical protein K4K51_006519 [Colletotrichum sp. SAR 10_75]|nr:hypothetical protein K4K51_006519 [Colletotrichum sp. SAR 10_75]